MQKNFEWPALCNFYSIPFPIFLQHRDIGGSQAWTLLRELKEWTIEEFEKQKIIFENDFASFDKTRFLNWGDPRYPANFSRLPVPPACVYYWGDLSILNEQSLSIIGSRQAAPCFLNWMDAELGAFLNQNNKLIVSGGARGIDQKATQVALRHRQKCVIVLPCGFEELYPAELAHWTHQENILFLSEYLPRQKMHRHHFIKRNRLVSALSKHLLVVQCAIKSGSMITVRYALEQGAHIATVPDFPGSYESSGNLKLLSEGATLVSDAQDLKDFMSW
jgi:DNA processing protein